MTLRLVLRNSVPASASPYRLLDQQGRELAWANNFLDAQRLRQLSLRSLRAYGYDLLHLARWLHQTRRSLAKINQSCLLDYVRRQLDHDPKPTPSTINHRLGVLRCLYRFHYGHEIPEGKSHFQRTYTTRSSLGYGRPQRRVARGLRLRQPHRVVVPLSADEVARFWKSFRTFRDLAIVALMLLDGLRSCEVLALQLEDLYLADAHLRVQGKGNKERALPLPAEYPRGPTKLFALGKTSDQLVLSVRVAEGPPARPPHECGGAALAVSPSPPVQQSSSSQSPSLSPHLRSRYGAGWNFRACLDAPDGTHPDSYHHALRRTRAPR